MLLFQYVERRLSGRIPMQRACIVNFIGRGVIRIAAITENVGRGGALIRLQDPAPVELGAHVAVELILNGELTSSRKCMYCRGIISRVLAEDPEGFARIGVRFDYVDFRPLIHYEQELSAKAIM